ncbi:hypothetical protein KUCAC02_009807 [Chaenocephalus aceratus]|uniref:Uncharacterized protein n=1 Tax=Chaenocephalus aceratus TaxID=36190 RepID=A0ACB9VZ35_CHAAC|nr:hypothetical protein KUCAC02_009807 [Chaenocephalus aceratus]
MPNQVQFVRTYTVRGGPLGNLSVTHVKELIQNADDAKATEVVFIHDDRSYGTESLWTDELGKYQGPALYAYNNAAFTGEDWEGIQMAGRSVKRNDPNKVGRFGIGFNSVYHITDVPSIFSSVHLGMMDPQEKIFGQRNSGFLWSLDDAEHQEALIEMHDQFQPFRDIVSLVGRKEWSTVINEDQHFDGTIFRFPLRKEASDISDNLYDSDRVVELFDSFIADADLSLLFLKNVTSVSLIHINVDGTVKTRLEVKSSISTDVVLESEDDSIIESSTRFKVITLNSEDHKETKWLLTTCTMKEGNVEHLDSLAKKLSFFPQVDLAFPCGEKRDSSESRLSCFLPLPNNESNKTGLPVYINACFGLTDNRREIKWQEEDQQHDEHAVWNELLMKEVLPQAYIMIIQDAIKLAQQDNLPVSSVYDLWPDIAQIKHKRKWYAVALDVLDHLFRQNVAVLSLAKDEREFITPSEAVFPCNAPTSSDILAAIKRTLVSCGENLVTLPGSVASAIDEAYPHLDTLKHVTPAFIRGSLRRIDVHTISKHDKLCLLEFILSDEKYRELEGLQLLPLNDGSFRSFTDREEDTALIDSNEFPRVLLPFCKHLFVPDDLRPACSAHLKELARENIFKVINIDAKRVAEYTKRFLPQDWKQMSKGHVTWDVSSNQHPPLEWLQEFWTFLNTHFKELTYPSKKDILKELIQNADDAEATEIHFVWDKRQHGTEKTFGEKWNELQGPALCVFNNKVFSDDDLEGIQQLGEGGKRNSPGKTGKYGVGFNSVYHLTDCPSILTGDKLLCISDPNQQFIDGHSDKPPAGTGYKLADTFKNMYMDVYKAFLPDKFPLKDGTMFRLPLRIGTMANSSKISLQEVTDHDMNELCSALSEDPEGLILFSEKHLQNRGL